MEMDGHPTQDIVDELVNRGAVLRKGTSAGPDRASPQAAGEQTAGIWVFLPETAYDTEIDEGPPPL